MNLRSKPFRTFLPLLLLWGVTITNPVRAEDSAPTTTVPTPTTTAPGTTPADVTVESFSIGPGGSLDPNQPGDCTNFSYDAPPGTVIHDSAIVYNVGNVPLPFHVYPTDGFNQKDGTFDLLTGDKAPVDVGAWVKFDSQDLTIPPGKQAMVPMTITVPADASPGDHVGGVVASSPVDAKNNSGQVLTFDRRVGAKVYIRVTGKLHDELAITKLNSDVSQSLNPVGGSAKVTFRIENRGDVRLGGTPVVTVSGPFGLGKKKITLPALVDLLPGGFADLSVEFHDVGAWFIDTTEVTITPVGTGDVGTVKSVRGSDATFAPPITALVAFALLVGLTLWQRRRRRRRRAEERPTTGLPERDLVGSNVR
ncbi:MAG: hypothetical protein WCK21_00760 [Actinomycetota bacterium]